MWGNKKTEVEGQVHLLRAEQSVPETNVPTRLSESPLAESSSDTVHPAVAACPKSSSRLGANLHVKGEISGQEDLYIDGTIEGLIELKESQLLIGPSAKLKADIVAREIVVQGSVRGSLHALNRIEVKKEASVIGDLNALRIRIEDGAHLKGSIEIDRKAGAESIIAEEIVLETAKIDSERLESSGYPSAASADLGVVQMTTHGL